VESVVNAVSSIKARLGRWAATVEDVVQRVLATAGLRHAESRIFGDSQVYWHTSGDDRWKANSHWRDAPVFAGSDLWSRIGREHLDMVERGARLVGSPRPWDRVIEWGCGGGANAVHFASRAKEFIGVDISADSLRECARQVDAVCDTPFRPVVVSVAEPEKAVTEVGGQCDLFLCCYVFELIPTPEYGERLLRIARDLLAPGGLALIQIKYDEGRWSTKPRRRAYRTGLAEMTTYPIATFWELAAACGLRPEAIQLVPKNELDERYAYYLLSKQDAR
jgi:SAM-dependent methyltransferase